MAIEIKDTSLCCGCMACANICPKDAIRAVPDENGFLYPQVDSEKCVQCGLCEKVCDFTQKKQAVYAPQQAVSLVHKDPTVVKNSTSGGAFTALSDLVLQQGGIVVGATMDESFTVYHHVAQTASQRDAMRGSLYVQSDIRDSYRQVRDALKEGKKVLFVGTPCQSAGLRSFLGRDDENLLVVEFLCHGVPNNDFLKAHIAFLEERSGKKAVGYSFRGKRYGWNPSGIEQITYDDGKTAASLVGQSYKHFFHTNVSLRPSCRACVYRKWERNADLTVGDFWGIEKLTGKKEKNGVSFVAANTHKGTEILKLLGERETLHSYSLEEIRYRIATKAARSRYDVSAFWQMYRQKGYAALVKKYHGISVKNQVLFAVKKMGRRLISGK